jgi:pimeloyl-ACP methyl ester carboxylesterase
MQTSNPPDEAGMGERHDIRLDTRQGRLAALAWRRDGAPRVLCLHGWLDNAASFLPLAPRLGRCDLVALDLPGHGHSEHRHPTARYHFIDYLFNLDAALDTLGWTACHLVGHSLGAAIAAVFAAAAPERVLSLTLLDGLGPMTGDPAKSGERLRRSLARFRQAPSAARRYGSIDEMVQARREVSDLSEAAARLICQRSAREEDGRFRWRSDPALNWVTPVLLTEEQVLDMLRHIEAPTLTFQATPESTWFSPERIAARKQAIAHGRHVQVEGHHHFHMDDPEVIADTIQGFILENDAAARMGEQT